MMDPSDDSEPIEDAEPVEDPRSADLPPTVKRRIEAFIPEVIKKTFAAGMGAVFSTEDGIRKMTRDLSLPKEVATYLATTAGNTKDEVIKIIAREVREFLQSVNLSDEIARMLTTLSFEVKTEIRFIPNDEKLGSVKPDVKARVRLKRQDERKRRRRRRRPRDASDAVSLPRDDDRDSDNDD